jgi:hypothetical protein
MLRVQDSTVHTGSKTKAISGINPGKDKIPASWEYLRKEAAPIFEKLNVFEAKLSQIDFYGK